MTPHKQFRMGVWQGLGWYSDNSDIDADPDEGCLLIAKSYNEALNKFILLCKSDPHHRPVCEAQVIRLFWM